MNPSDLNRFSVNPVSIDIPRSVFNRNHSVKLSCNIGECIPFLFENVMPGDTWSVDTTKVVRLQPLVTPIMDNVVLDTYYFFVPYRLVWNHFINFMGENTDSAWTPTVEYTIPQISIPSGGFNVGTVADYLGVPPKVYNSTSPASDDNKINALPFRAYALVCDQWFRSEALQNPVHVTVDDTTVAGSNGSDQTTDIEKGGKPFIACKLPDYFTMALPEPQSGPDVTFSLAGIAPVNAYSDLFVQTGLGRHDVLAPLTWKESNNGGTTWSDSVPSTSRNLGIYKTTGQSYYDSSTAANNNGYIITPDNLYADMSTISQFSINELRNAFAVQRYYEKLARGGRRYIEQIQAFYNVKSPDARLQRSEYLGGNRMPINVTQVEQTSSTDATSPQGNVVGMSLTGDDHSDFSKSFTEHGCILGICVARYQHTYQQGIERFFSAKTVFDLYNPTFANIGEQGIKKSEIYFTGDRSEDEKIFGYQEAWADYRYKANRVCGEMRSVHTTPLDMWHLADNYNSVPSLGDSWIREDKTMLDRCLAVTSSVSNQMIMDFYIQSDVARPMPLHSIPGLIDHH